jgi:hypothetical protein
MIVTIHQPDFLPWLGFFKRWKQSDIYIVLDDVQFIRRGWHHRDKIKTAHGIKWLTVPVKKKSRYYQKISEVEIDYHENWQQSHFGIVKAAYSKAKNFDLVFDALTNIYSENHRFLIDLNMDFLRYCATQLGIDTPVLKASSYPTKETKSRKLLELVNAVGGSVYLTGTGSMDYLDEKIFSEAGVEVKWQGYENPIYQQLHGKFEKMLSVLDYLMVSPRPYDILL